MLDALGDQQAADLGRVADQSPDQGGAVGVPVDPADQRAVELEVVGDDRGDLAQARVAGADVVDREAGPAPAERPIAWSN